VNTVHEVYVRGTRPARSDLAWWSGMCTVMRCMHLRVEHVTVGTVHGAYDRGTRPARSALVRWSGMCTVALMTNELSMKLYT